MDWNTYLLCPNESSAMGIHQGLYQNGTIRINNRSYQKWKCKVCSNLYISSTDFSNGAIIEIYGLTINNCYNISNKTLTDSVEKQDNTNDYNKVVFDEYKYGLYSILSKMKLYEKITIEEVKAKFPEYHGEFIIVDEINELLNEIEMEVTYLNNYYIIVEPGFHKKRLDTIKEVKNLEVKDTYPKYRDDISTTSGRFHLRRDETGKISSDTLEDNYD